MKLTLFFLSRMQVTNRFCIMNARKEEHIYITKKKGYHMQNKEEKDIKVKVVYGNKTLLECMKNIIKNSRK